MIVLERSYPTRVGGHLLATTWLIGISMVLVALLSIVSVAGQLGFDVIGGRDRLDIGRGAVYLLATTATLCLVAAGIGWLRRPKAANDDLLRVSAPALVLCSLGLACSATILVVDLARHPWGWPILGPYFVLLGAVNALHYLEEIIHTPVRIHVLTSERPAWILGLLSSLCITLAVLWLGERVLWGPGRQGATLAVIAQGVGILGLVLLAIFAANLVIANGAGPQQQLTVKSSASNAIQSQLLYGVQAAVTTCIPSIMVMMLRPNLLANVKPLLVGAVFAGLMWSVAAFAHKNNAEHLESERTRPLSATVTRRRTPDERTDLQTRFVERLARHIALQEKLSRLTFKVSGLWVFVLVAELIDWVKRSDGRS